MSVLIQDTARNTLAGWTTTGLKRGTAAGAILSPFSSPKTGNSYKIDATRIADRIRKAGGEFWFDPTTHALQMPQAGDFRYYDEWDLWSGDRNRLETAADQREHVRRVFNIQDQLGVPLLGPTVLLHSSQSQKSLQAIDLAEVARSEAGSRDVWLSIVGDSQFWASGADLDAHIGVLDQLEPAGWMVSVVRPQSTIPVAAHGEEIAGMMRTVFALSQDRPVIIGHGDFAGLPGVAAGAKTIGSGGDIRQRVCSYTDYVARPLNGSDFGSWYKRPTLGGLFGAMSTNEYNVLLDQDQALAQRLTPGHFIDTPGEAFQHHIRVLAEAVENLNQLSGEARVRQLQAWYSDALKEWPEAQRISGCAAGGTSWVAPLLDGVELFIRGEGW
ncbi:hypothetical protein [Pseudarthrobacter sp. NIBRBAC000502770]|uniref:hypothetical protein n=1 Tax=Pseudarthrobacter sp. NIBRBAC000502770 TaxID=2590785 RepID=UPI00113FC597|nr:hypothetical protein [Pseudarthrobacter sp. NIBRBAC000502770]QDG89946.1 hypothetical protein NIBR502770_16695 [Pseudarthrobacter sp. NIBRBAC000502770]